ncbi:hypothetical protein K438DRAFT_1561914 [Mycena galopus ATCC 62051]|nr:hypothetical protein K438DRAFT_1561914 [Mycena galopus ATCC 62051]
MPAIQITTFPVSDSFVANPDVMKDALSVITGAEGYQSSFYGPQVEDKKTAYFISVWETYAHREKLDGTPQYGQLIEKLKPAVAGPLVRDHIDVTVDPTAALSAPAVAFVTFTLKSGESVEKLTALVGEFAKSLDGTGGVHAPTAWGQSAENKDKVLVITGWDSLEVSVCLLSILVAILMSRCPVDAPGGRQERFAVCSL